MDTNLRRDTGLNGDLSGDGDGSDWRAALAATCDRLWQAVREAGPQARFHLSDSTTYVLADAMTWLATLPPASIHAIVTDPPYGLVEYEARQLAKRRAGRGGVWRIPPAFDGAKRAPLPRFTVLTGDDLAKLQSFFATFATAAMRALVPGGHIFMASNPLLSTAAFHALQEAGLEKRGEVIRLVQTLRGGDKPKGAEGEFPGVSMMPRAGWEPWGIFRKPFAGTAADNLRAWGTGGLRRPAGGAPLKDVIPCAPTRGVERELAPHPSLKPQRFLRQVVRAALPLGIGIVCDPFAGSGSSLAAAAAVGYRAIGADHSVEYFELARTGVPRLTALTVNSRES
jgi:site-specific DNA-methyltransferase (adenine-specific)